MIYKKIYVYFFFRHDKKPMIKRKTRNPNPYLLLNIFWIYLSDSETQFQIKLDIILVNT